MLTLFLAQCTQCKDALSEGLGESAPLTELSLGMGWSIYFMLLAVLGMVGWIVFLIIRSEKQRQRRLAQ